jgi:serralysin
MTRESLIALGAIVLMGGCAASNEPLGWEEFAASAYREADTGVYVINGDEIAENLDQLREAYFRYRAEQESDGVASTQEPLIVNRVNGHDDKWSTSTAANLTYCVSQPGFTGNYNAVVNAMNSASAAWEATARVNFVHRSQFDGNCRNATSSQVLFRVLHTSGQPFLARSFFPSSSFANRTLVIDQSSFGQISPYTLTGIVRHELGHTLGFRHEHTRPEAGGVCFEDNNWRALTTYDSASVMHYPQCNGTNHGDLVLTSRDQSGARSLYP